MGITLIALVVTIIVLLILAGVSISMLNGENGILKRAREAKEKTEVSQENENTILKNNEKMINIYMGDFPENADGQEADTPIKNPSDYGNYAQATADGNGKIFAKPYGATYVTGTVDTGVVVNIKESEFVWVPVEDVVFDEKKYF